MKRTRRSAMPRADRTSKAPTISNCTWTAAPPASGSTRTNSAPAMRLSSVANAIVVGDLGKGIAPSVCPVLANVRRMVPCCCVALHVTVTLAARKWRGAWNPGQLLPTKDESGVCASQVPAAFTTLASLGAADAGAGAFVAAGAAHPPKARSTRTIARVLRAAPWRRPTRRAPRARTCGARRLAAWRPRPRSRGLRACRRAARAP